MHLNSHYLKNSLTIKHVTLVNVCQEIVIDEYDITDPRDCQASPILNIYGAK